MLKYYPQLSFVLLSYVFVGILFEFLGPNFFHALVAPFGIGGIFIAGMMYSYSLTTSIGALLLPAFLAQSSVPLIALVGGFGGTFADFTVFRFIKGNLRKEVRQLGKTRFMKAFARLPFMNHPWFRDVLGVLVIMSPFPDEIGVAIMASTHLSENNFRILSLIANTIGIYLLVSALAVVY